jgi:hypothetical protein
LTFGSDTYAGIISALPENRKAQRRNRQNVDRSLVSNDGRVRLSNLGVHSSLKMTLRPEFCEGMQFLLLRTTVQMSTRVMDLDFTDCQIAFLGLTPGAECQHPRNSSVVQGETIMATSVLTPIPLLRYQTGVTLTHWNGEAQFLSCMTGFPALYQGDCCMECAIRQAQRLNRRLVIGGSERNTHLIDGVKRMRQNQ